MTRDGHRTRVLVLFALYAASFGAAALHGGIYWDDWTLYHVAPDLILNHFVEAGRPQFGLLHWLGFQLPAPIATYKLATFALGFSAALLFGALLRRARLLSEDQRWLAMALFAVLPLNQARESLVIMQYPLCLNLFLLGHLVAERGAERGWAWKAAGFALLFLSFSIEAYLALVVLTYPLYVWGARLQWRRPTREELVAFARAELAVLVAPFVYFAIKQVFLQPRGFNAGNNVITVSALRELPFGLMTALFESFWTAFARAFAPGPALQLAVLFVLVSLVTGYALRGLRPDGSRRVARLVLGVGAVLTVVAIVPFLAVGKVPSVEDWSSRMQVPQAIGMSLMLTGAIACLGPRTSAVVAALLLSLSVTSNVGYRVQYLWDNYKQQSLRTALARTPQVRAARAFLVQDRASHLNALGRTYRFYEYTGMLKALFGDEQRLVASVEEFPRWAKMQRMASSHERGLYSMSNVSPSAPAFVAVLTTRLQRPDLIDTAEIAFAAAVDRPHYAAVVDSIIRLEVRPLP